MPMTSIKRAAVVAECVRARFAETPVVFEGSAIPVTTSIGVAAYRHPETPESLLARADERLYEAKSSGRNRVLTDEEVRVRV